jgi:glycosyltransferase involved in cell wall biosynthesis
MLTPMVPDPHAAGAMPVLFDAALSGLAARHDVTLVTVAGPDPRELEAVRRLARAGIDVHAAERRPLPTRATWARRRRLGGAWLEGRWPWRTIWFWQPRVQELLDRLGRRRRFDIVLAEDSAMAIYRLPPAPLRVLTEHEVRRPRSVAAPPRAPGEWAAWALREADWARWPAYQRAMWSRFDRVQVFTRRDADAIATLAPQLADRVRVNPFALTLPPAPDPAAPVDADSLVFLGNYSHPPNVDAALWLSDEILPRVRDLHPAARLSLAGDHAPPRVRALARADLRVLGRVDDADALLARNTVVVAPVRTGGGMRMKVLHAMALARPVVTTTRGSEGLSVASRTPPLVVADDADAIAAATVRLLRHPADRAALGAAARAYVAEHHSPQSWSARLEAVCDEPRP